MPDTKPKPFVFVLMPFSGDFEDVYKLGIKAACIEAGAYCERVDEQIFQESILSRIYNQTAKADIVVADMTGRNPNVFYEVGYAHALGKQVILLTQKSEDIPFDLKHYPHVVYSGSISFLKDELGKRIRWFVEHPTGRIETVEKPLELYIGNVPLRDCPTLNVGHMDVLEVKLHNPTSRTFVKDSFKMGVDMGGCFSLRSELSGRVLESVGLPGNRKLFFLPPCGTLFPSAWDKMVIRVIMGEAFGLTEAEPVEDVTFRVFTELGTINFPVKFRTK